jgi:hypothetical protein
MFDLNSSYSGRNRSDNGTVRAGARTAGSGEAGAVRVARALAAVALLAVGAVHLDEFALGHYGGSGLE